jgi:hypothetical protein
LIFIVETLKSTTEINIIPNSSNLTSKRRENTNTQTELDQYSKHIQVDIGSRLIIIM